MTMTDDDLRLIIDALRNYDNQKFPPERLAELMRGFERDLYERQYLENALMKLAER